MSPPDERTTEFEQHASVLLERSVTRIDSRIRSRLNQARQAAVAEVAGRNLRHGFWNRFVLVPTAGVAAAAVLVAMMVMQHHPGAVLQTENGQVAVEDLDLVADSEGLDMVEEPDGSFYEWAAEQDDNNGETSS